MPLLFVYLSFHFSGYFLFDIFTFYWSVQYLCTPSQNYYFMVFAFVYLFKRFHYLWYFNLCIIFYDISHYGTFLVIVDDCISSIRKQ